MGLYGNDLKNYLSEENIEELSESIALMEGYETEYEMVDEYCENIQGLSESFLTSEDVIQEGFFPSPDGKKVKKRIKEICKETKSKFSLKDAMKYNYDEDIVKKISAAIKKEFTISSESMMIESVYVDQYGNRSYTYYKMYRGIKGKYIYQFGIRFTANKGALYGFSEIDMEKKLIYPKDVVEYALKNCGDIPLGFTKASIFVQIETKGGIKNAKSDFSKILGVISDYVDKKYPEYQVKAGKVLNRIKFKKPEKK